MHAAPAPVQTSRFYLPQLDGARFLMFVLVFFHHFLVVPTSTEVSQRVTALIGRVQAFGWMSVELFLTLSAFLITVLLAREYEKSKTISVRQFYMRRILRIWPLYYGALFVGFVVTPMFGFMMFEIGSEGYWLALKHHLPTFGVFFGNLSYAGYNDTVPLAIAPLWTIALEEQFYLVWPVLMLALLRTTPRRAVMVLVGIMIFSIYARTYIILNEFPYPSIWTLTPGRVEPFALGGLVGLAYARGPLRIPGWLAALGSAVCIVGVACIPTNIDSGLHSSVWQIFFADVGAALFLCAALTIRPLIKVLSFRPFAFFGKISYGLYVFHFITIYATINVLLPKFIPAIDWGHPDWPHWLFAYAVAFAVTAIVAICSYYGFERHFLKLKVKHTMISSRPL